jgi:hypothetical protein
LLVYDNVLSIVPAEAGYVPSEYVKRHLEKLPDTFAPLAPEPLDIVHEYFVLKILQRAFKKLAGRRGAKPGQERQIHFKNESSEWGDEVLEISGITKLHDGKVAHTVFDWLKEYGLIYGKGEDGFHYVDEQAACLIVSFIAQRMATRLPLRTITDVDSSFYLSAACDLIDSGNPINSRGVLASAVLKFHIPENIDKLTVSEFVEIRKRYEQLRETFPLYLRDLGELIQIDDVTQLPELRSRIESVVKRLDHDMETIKKSQSGRSITRWLPVGIGSAVTLGTAFLPHNPAIKYVTGGVSVAVQILTEALHKSPIPGRLEGTQSLLLNAKKDIINRKDMTWSLSMNTLL